jgi:hypothetical protein
MCADKPRWADGVEADVPRKTTSNIVKKKKTAGMENEEIIPRYPG